MTFLWGNLDLSDQEIKKFSDHILKEHNAINLSFVEQTNHYCTFKGEKEERKYNFKFDKNEYDTSIILEKEIIN